MSTRDDVAKQSSTTSVILRDSITYWRSRLERDKSDRRDLLSYDRLNERCKLSIAESTFSEWLNDESGRIRLRASAHRALAHYLYDEGFLTNTHEIYAALDGIADYLFHAVNRYMAIGDVTIENMILRATGTYRVWRPSVHIRGSFVLGMMEVEKVKGASAVEAIETQRYDGSDGSIERTERFAGYLFRRDKNYFVIARDDSARSLRVTMLHSAVFEHKIVVFLEGVAMGIYGKYIYTAPICLERIAENKKRELETTLNIVEENAVPVSIRQKLRDVKQGDVFLF